MRKRVLFLLLTLMALVMLVACGEQQEDPTKAPTKVPTEAAPTGETAAPTTEPAAPTTEATVPTTEPAAPTSAPTSTPKPTSAPVAKNYFDRGTHPRDGGVCMVSNEKAIFSWLRNIKTDKGTVKISASENRWSEEGEIDPSTLKIQILVGEETYTISSGYFYPFEKGGAYDDYEERFSTDCTHVLRFEYSQIKDSKGEVYATEGIFCIYFNGYETSDKNGDPVDVVTWYDTALGKDEFMKNKHKTILITPYGNVIEFHGGTFENINCSVLINHNYLNLERYDIWIQAPNNDTGFVAEGNLGVTVASVTPGSQQGDYFKFTFVDDDGYTGVFTLDMNTYKATMTHPVYNGGNTFELDIKKIE